MPLDCDNTLDTVSHTITLAGRLACNYACFLLFQSCSESSAHCFSRLLLLLFFFFLLSSAFHSSAAAAAAVGCHELVRVLGGLLIGEETRCKLAYQQMASAAAAGARKKGQEQFANKQQQEQQQAKAAEEEEKAPFAAAASVKAVSVQ